MGYPGKKNQSAITGAEIVAAINTELGSTVWQGVGETITLGDLTLSNNTYPIDAPIGSVIGAILGKTTNSQLAVTGTAFAIDNANNLVLGLEPIRVEGLVSLTITESSSGVSKTNDLSVTAQAPVVMSPWRTAANNTLPQQVTSAPDAPGGQRTSLAVRQYYIIGSDNWDEITFDFNNFVITDSAATELSSIGCDLDFKEVFIAYNGTTLPVTQGNSATFTALLGATENFVDTFSPSDFGATKFTRGTEVELRLIVKRTVEAGGSNNTFPSSFSYIGNYQDPGRFRALHYCDAEGEPTNMSEAGAPITLSGGLNYARATSYRPILMGRKLGTEADTFGVIGDSIEAGQGDTGSDCKYGASYTMRSMVDEDGFSNPRAVLNMAKGGASYGTFSGTGERWKVYLKYFNVMVNGMAENDFGGGGENKTAEQMLTDTREFNTIFRENGITKIIHCLPLTRTSGPWTLVDGSDQTIAGPGWGAGGEVEQYRNLMLPLAPSEMEAVIQFESYKNASDPYKWLADGNTNTYVQDGLHAKAPMYALLASELRPVYPLI